MTDNRCRKAVKTQQSKSRVERRAPNEPRSAPQSLWAKEEDALLGKLADRKVVEKLNRTLGSVRDRRKFLGKPAVGHAPQLFRIERQLPDKEVARRTGHSLTSVRHARTNRHILSVRRAAPEWQAEEEALAGHSARYGDCGAFEAAIGGGALAPFPEGPATTGAAPADPAEKVEGMTHSL